MQSKKRSERTNRRDRPRTLGARVEVLLMVMLIACRPLPAAIHVVHTSSVVHRPRIVHHLLKQLKHYSQA